MDRQSYLNLMQFPPEWQDWDMLPTDFVDAQLAGYESGHEHGSEHDRHSVFQWWLKQSASVEQLVLLVRLTWLDPDQMMAGYVRDCIAKKPQLNGNVAVALASPYHRGLATCSRRTASPPLNSSVRQNMLTAFWFNTSSGLGFGVTAESRAAAEELLRKYGYPSRGVEITSVVAGVEFAALDQKHVVPNAGPIVVRGIWYPRHNV